ncbi:MAG: hypothetical protein FWB74_03070 [Defluviitaleaceae bacterium]|nr:hypothetical protein [Defluviitaleaceae bacterium]
MEATREILHGMIDNIDSKNFGIIRHILIGFIPEDEPYPDEIEAIKRSEASIAEFGTVGIDDIDWKQ